MCVYVNIFNPPYCVIAIKAYVYMYTYIYSIQGPGAEDFWNVTYPTLLDFSHQLQ